MDLSKFFCPSTGTFRSEYSDKRTRSSIVTGTTETTHEGAFIKRVVNFEFDGESPYPSRSESLIPLSIIKDGKANWSHEDPEYGTVITDIVIVRGKVLENIRSENGELIGSAVREMISPNIFRQAGFLYNGPDDLLRWETTSIIKPT